MLDRHRFLQVNDYESCREIYAATGLHLTPHSASACGDGFHALANRWSMPRLSLYYYNFSGSQTLTSQAFQSDYWLTFPVKRGSDGRRKLVSRISKFSSPTRDDPVDVAGGHGMIGLRVDGAALNSFASAFLHRDMQDHVLFEPEPQRRAAVDASISSQVMAAIATDAQDPDIMHDPLWQERLFSAICANLLTFWPHTYQQHLTRPTLGPAPRDLKLVLDYIEGHLEQPLSLLQLSEIGGVPIRTLSDHFTRFVGLSPISYIRHRRMLRIHRALSRNEFETVTDATLHYGITSAGRFAGEYRQLFGETPSETLRRAQ